MYLMYVDESGDPGKCVNIGSGNSNHYSVSGLIISESDWYKNLEKLNKFRKHLKERYGLLLKTEIHASELIRISKIKEYRRIRKMDRMKILGEVMEQIPVIFDTSKIINIFLDKSIYPEKEEFQTFAWSRLIQRYDTCLKSKKENGIVICDDTDEKLLRNLLRKMRVYNPVPSHFTEYYNAPTDNIIEDIFHRNSQHSYFIQMVDAITHCLFRKEMPKSSLKKYGVDRFFGYLKPILLLEASKYDEFGIVRK